MIEKGSKNTNKTNKNTRTHTLEFLTGFSPCRQCTGFFCCCFITEKQTRSIHLVSANTCHENNQVPLHIYVVTFVKRTEPNNTGA